MAYFIQDHCVACLKCKAECPTGAIRITADCPIIDENICISCGTCAQVCKECAPMDAQVRKECAPMDAQARKGCAPMDAQARKECAPMDAQARKECAPMDAQARKECAPMDAQARTEEGAGQALRMMRGGQMEHLAAGILQAEAPSHRPDQLDCDVLVLGGGGSGLVAAARVSWNTGLKVILMEKQKRTGGGAWYAADFKVFNSRWQRERGIPDILEDSVLRAMDDTYWLLDPQLAANSYQATGRFFDWLCDTGEDVEEQFQEGTYIFDGPNGPKIPVFKKRRYGKQGGTGKYVCDQMLRLCREQGVRILTETEAVELLADQGKVTGAVCRDRAGKIRIRCRSCILATGSWIQNQWILERVDPKFAAMPRVRSAHRSDAYTGDGVKLAFQAGARIDWDSMCLRLMGPVFLAGDNTPYATFGAMQFDPTVIQVNKRGERWNNEQTVSRKSFFHPAIPLREQPDGVSYTIFNRDCVEAAIARSKNGIAPKSPFAMPEIPAHWEEELRQAQEEYGFAFFRAESVRELAELAGIDPDGLERTVSRYNAMCQAGKDADYMKSKDGMVPLCHGPFYALRCALATDGAFGGVPVNAEMLAYAETGGIMENLYVTGDFASGRFINQGGVKVQILHDLAWAFSSGFLAGEHAAAQFFMRTGA